MSRQITAFLMYVLFVGCDYHAAPQTNNRSSLGALPRLKTTNGTEIPYFRYKELTGRKASRGLAVFLYPIKKDKMSFLALEYSPGTDIKLLFGEDLLGRDGDFRHTNDMLTVESFPLSLRTGSYGSGRWHMKYVNRDFTCTGSLKKYYANASILEVSCVSADYRLSFLFDKLHGVIQFQDFCDNAVCTYRLMDDSGFLSQASLTLASAGAIEVP